MKRFVAITLAITAALLSSTASAQATTTLLPSSPSSSSSASTSVIILPSGAVPTPPPGSRANVGQLIAEIPACWVPCVGGAIKAVCGSNDTWTCACDTPSDAESDFATLALNAKECSRCNSYVGQSDGGVLDIQDLLFNICISIPYPFPSAAGTGEVSPEPTPNPTAAGTGEVSPEPTHNVAATNAIRPWYLLGAPIAVVIVGMALF